MSEILRTLADGATMSEWVNPWDERLVAATGEQPPNRGGSLREAWHLPNGSGRIAAMLLRKCLLPPAHLLGGNVEASFNKDITYVPVDNGAVVFNFSERNDWLGWFPAGEKTKIFKGFDDEQAWAAVGIFGRLFGLAVFSQELDTGIEARIQPVPKAMFEKIIGAE